MIAVVVHVIVIAVFSIVYIERHIREEAAVTTTVAVKPAEEKTEEPDEIKPPEAVDRSTIPKPQNVEAEVTSLERDTGIALDTPIDPRADLSQEAGDPTGESPQAPSGGTALGVGGGGGYYGTGKPSAFSGRRDPNKVPGGPSGRAGGPTQGTEEAVLRGLRWLIRHQNEDGSWSAATVEANCDPKGCCFKPEGGVEAGRQYDEGLTGLSLLAFLGAGYGHDAKQFVVDTVRARKHKLGDVVKNGLRWLKDRQAEHADGRFSADGFMYNEALATLAMCEAYGLSGHEYWKDSAQRGVDFLVASQRRSPNGQGLWGWRYEPRSWLESDAAKQAYGDVNSWQKAQSESDTSVTAWVVMALKSGELAGLKVPAEAWQGTMDFVNFVTVKDGRVAYMDPRQVGMKIRGDWDHYDHHQASMVALGMCIRTFIEKRIDDPMLEVGAELLLKDLPVVSKNQLSVDYYYWYYGTLALNQFDGPDSPRRSNKYWGPWNKAMQDTLIALQDDTAKSCQNGSWPTPDRWSFSGGPIYRTAVNVLTLEVYYRYANAFGSAKKTTAVPEKK